jgi:glycosyltransferase involved in cell wall biosynthesis
MHLLFDALSLLADDWPYDSPLPVLLAAGNAMNFSALRKKGFTLVDLGFVDVDTLAKAYAAADLFACPSIEDSGPMMINESMMSGTPVVSFRMGVAEDLIEDGITGAIAELGNVVEFTEGMRRILLWDMDQHAFARQRCRNLAIEKCSNEYQLENFVKVAEELVKTAGVG